MTNEKCSMLDAQWKTPSLPSLPSVQDPAVAASVRSHAIKRWRAHIPRPKGTPEPDGSWRDECPCGALLPCEKHPDLYQRIRAYRPQHPSYENAMKEAGIFYYIPAAEELGCSQEELDKSRDPFAYNPRLNFIPRPRINPFASPSWPSKSIRG